MTSGINAVTVPATLQRRRWQPHALCLVPSRAMAELNVMSDGLTIGS
jgi:hypothetical protein